MSGGSVAIRFAPQLEPNNVVRIAFVQTVAVSIGSVTQLSSPSGVSLSSQDGYAAGNLSSFTIGQDGTVQGVFSNGAIQLLVLGMVNDAERAVTERSHHAIALRHGRRQGRTGKPLGSCLAGVGFFPHYALENLGPTTIFTARLGKSCACAATTCAGSG